MALRIAARRGLFQGWPTGVGQTQEPRGFVKRLADGIVNGGAEPPVTPDTLHDQ